jgi:hypothetical protein
MKRNDVGETICRGEAKFSEWTSSGEVRHPASAKSGAAEVPFGRDHRFISACAIRLM